MAFAPFQAFRNFMGPLPGTQPADPLAGGLLAPQQGYMTHPNANMFLGLGGGLLAHRQNAWQNPLGNAFQAGMQGAQIDTVSNERKAERAEATRRTNQTAAWLLSKGLAKDQVEADTIVSNPTLLANALKGPEKPDYPNSFDEWRYAQDNPGYADFLKSNKGGMTFNLGPTGIDYGEPEKGLVWARNPDGSVRQDERGAPIAIPYQGGPAFVEQQAAQTAAGAKQAAQNRTGNIVLQDIDRALDKVTKSPGWTTGALGNLTSNIPGTESANVKSLIQTVRANVGFSQLQAMRESSPTGGALGNVTEREVADLQAAMGSLEQSQDAQQLADNLKRVKNVYLDIVHGPGQGPPREKLGFSTGGSNLKPNDDGSFDWVP